MNQKLYTAPPGEPKYALGWILAEGQPWAGGPALSRGGNNSMWYAVAWLTPERDFAVLVACNQADPKACDEAVLALKGNHSKGGR